MYFFSILILCCLIFQTFSRPSRVLEDYDKDSNEDTYADTFRSDKDGYFRSEQRPSRKRFSDSEPNSKEDLQDENVSNSDDDELSGIRADKDYLENSDEADADDNNSREKAESAHMLHNDMLITGNEVKRTDTQDKENNMLFQNDEELRKLQQNNINTYETLNPSERARYLNQYKNLRKVNRNVDVKIFGKERESVVRDRREVKKSETDELIDTEEISTSKNEHSTNEDEEATIRRHIKNLSKEELDKLLNSLSEDKRVLLKSIIDNCNQEYDNINKREITKKAGANEENSFVGNEQSDISKLQGGAANIETEFSMSPNTETPENTKKVEGETIYSTSTEIAGSSEKPSDKVGILDGLEDTKLEKTEIKDNLESSQTDKEQEMPKNQKKREMNSMSLNPSESKMYEPVVLSFLNNEDLYCSDTEHLPQLLNDESSLYNNNINKREACSDNEDTFKSLEDSFPNGYDASNVRPGSDMVPLVRVKRKNLDKNIQKRDANLMSNVKVPFFSNAIENNDEDSDEGSEFQDDGFLDRRANFAKSSEINRESASSSFDTENNFKKNSNSQPTDTDNNNLDSDNVRLGSDTDAVLSGIEGVDDNMMYNSVSRNKRTADILNYSMNNDNDNEKSNKQRGTLKEISENEDNEIGENNSQLSQLSPRYQENDAFGSLPRNYEEDLGRFKRIRRLKPLLTT